MQRCLNCNQIKPENRECPTCAFTAWAGSTPTHAPRAVKSNLRDMQEYANRRHGKRRR